MQQEAQEYFNSDLYVQPNSSELKDAVFLFLQALESIEHM
jgi:hypothetical protein